MAMVNVVLLLLVQADLLAQADCLGPMLSGTYATFIR